MDLLINLCNFYLCVLVLYTWRDKNLCGTNLCDQRLTHIICINKSHPEICRFIGYNMEAYKSFGLNLVNSMGVAIHS